MIFFKKKTALEFQVAGRYQLFTFDVFDEDDKKSDDHLGHINIGAEQVLVDRVVEGKYALRPNWGEVSLVFLCFLCFFVFFVFFCVFCVFLCFLCFLCFCVFCVFLCFLWFLWFLFFILLIFFLEIDSPFSSKSQRNSLFQAGISPQMKKERETREREKIFVDIIFGRNCEFK